ncbi:galactose mutarotase, partial [Vibrio parahaemolyticus V-223/04]
RTVTKVIRETSM